MGDNKLVLGEKFLKDPSLRYNSQKGFYTLIPERYQVRVCIFLWSTQEKTAKRLKIVEVMICSSLLLDWEIVY